MASMSALILDMLHNVSITSLQMSREREQGKGTHKS